MAEPGVVDGSEQKPDTFAAGVTLCSRARGYKGALVL